MKFLVTLTPLFYFVTIIKMKSLTTHTILSDFTAIKIKSLTLLTMLPYFVITLKMKSLTAHTKLVFFRYYSNEISD